MTTDQRKELHRQADAMGLEFIPSHDNWKGQAVPETWFDPEEGIAIGDDEALIIYTGIEIKS